MVASGCPSDAVAQVTRLTAVDTMTWSSPDLSVRSCHLMSCPNLFCLLPFSPGMPNLLFLKDVNFEFIQFLLLLFPSFSVVPLSVFLSVFVFLFYKRSGSNFHFYPRPYFEHLSTVQACTQTQPHFACSRTSRAHFTLVPTVCVSSPKDWAEQDIDVATPE